MDTAAVEANEESDTELNPESDTELNQDAVECLHLELSDDERDEGRV